MVSRTRAWNSCSLTVTSSVSMLLKPCLGVFSVRSYKTFEKIIAYVETCHKLKRKKAFHLQTHRGCHWVNEELLFYSSEVGNCFSNEYSPDISRKL